MQHVLVVDAQRRPLMPCRPARARLLLTYGKAAVLRRFPFTLVLLEAKPEAVVESVCLKIDPGAKTTGIALLLGPHQTPHETSATPSCTAETVGEVVWAAELSHRGEEVHEALDQRRACRRSRRARHTRYRPERRDNRRRPARWLPPSLGSRIQNVMTWVERLCRWCPIGAISLEAVRFDTQLLQNPDIAGVEYQRGTLAGTELREYLLFKWGYRCAYCHQSATATNPWEIDHILPRSRGGSNRPSNLALSCHVCNSTKGSQTAQEYGHPDVQAHAKAPLKDAAAVNSTRRALQDRLREVGLRVETASGGVTKWNRTQRGLPKTHWLDAVCVGRSAPERVQGWHTVVPLLITAERRQRRQMCLVDGSGFPRTKAKGRSRVFGFKTGDLVQARVPSGKKAGDYNGRVAIRASGSFNITTARGTVEGISYRSCRAIQRLDGYSYAKGVRAFVPTP